MAEDEDPRGSLERVLARLKSEDMLVASLEINDAIDDLQDALRKTIAGFRDRMVPPGFIHIEGGVLEWTTNDLFFHRHGEKRPAPILSCSMWTRLHAAKAVESLYEVCTRKREPSSMSVKICDVCNLRPEAEPQGLHPAWCTAIKKLEAKVNRLEKDLVNLAKAAGPAIAGSILYK